MAENAERPDAWMSGDARYRILVDAVIDYAIYMLDPSGIVASWNSGAQRLKGYLEQEIIGEHFSRFYMDEDRQAGLPQRALATAEREGKFENQGCWRLRKDGTRFWAHVVIDPIRDASQRHRRLAGLHHMPRPSHCGGRIERHGLTGDQPAEQHAHRGELPLHACRPVFLL